MAHNDKIRQTISMHSQYDTLNQTKRQESERERMIAAEQRRLLDEQVKRANQAD